MSLILPYLHRSYWQVILSTGRIVSERQTTSHHRPLDWTLDLVTTQDVYKVQELQLVSPHLNYAWLKIIESGTAFQFKTSSSLFELGAAEKVAEAQVIGRVDNKLTGDCTCWIFDRLLGMIPYSSNIKEFGSWHPRIAFIHDLQEDVIGLIL